MKNYKITVNGKCYDVEVEEVSGYPQTMSTTSAPASSQNMQTSASSAPQSQTKGESVVAPLQGMVLTISVKKGDRVKKGDLLMKIEAMKMENEILSPCDGVVDTISVNDGDRVSSGDVLINII